MNSNAALLVLFLFSRQRCRPAGSFIRWPIRRPSSSCAKALQPCRAYQEWQEEVQSGPALFVFHVQSQRMRRMFLREGQGNCSTASVAPSITASELHIEHILDQMSFALGLHLCPLNYHFTVTGRQKCFGLEGDWRLTWCLDGRFYEQFIGEEIVFEHGYDGKHSPWHADASGYVTDLHLDNLEACLSALWVRTGYWLTGGGRLNLLIKKKEVSSLNDDAYTNNELWLSISLKGKKIESHVLVDTTSWLPVRMELKAFGGVERWEFANWADLMLGFSYKFAMSTAYLPAAGGKHVYNGASNGMACSSDSSDINIYDYNPTVLKPRYLSHHPRIQVDNSCSPSVEMIRVRSGHHVVRPLIDGKDMGYFIVDTGASCLVISAKKANEVEMPAFGELYITGVEGKFKSQFRRGKSLELGPLKIDFPVFIEAPSDDVVKGVAESVSGILGYDIFCRAIVEMSSADFKMSFYDPLLYRPLNREVNWEVLHMLDNTPHALAKFMEQSALLMLDTGAGGIDVIFHKRAVKEFNLLSSLDWRGQVEISGVGDGNDKGGIKVQHGILNQVEVAGQSFSNVKTLYFSGDEQALDISIYTSGILCGEIIMCQLVIFDYPNSRFALVRN
ncbi:hypothetical protein GOP47_0015597 [Adiantum capillus-veneris]|uniref:Uncharacterized protein n=1 Tax=Adiantum capillus-veneris TaxID=13818 RepID=A0A9D4ZE43_ADICA|nr:hypothetical protein GOP47_0015597 [Adiantum capillus-veneris]